MQQAVAHAEPFAAVPRVLHEAHFGIGLSEARHQTGGLIGGTVVDDDNLGGPLVRANAGHYRLERSNDPGALVVRRDDDAVFRGAGHGPSLLSRGIRGEFSRYPGTPASAESGCLRRIQCDDSTSKATSGRTHTTLPW